MYESYFGMSKRPFGATPNLQMYYPTAEMEEGVAALRYAVTTQRGMALVVGPAGTGKTLACNRLLTTLPQDYLSATINNTNLRGPKCLLQAILFDLTLPYRGLDEQELRLALTDFLTCRFAGNEHVVIVIDEAQNLPDSVLEEVRLLDNLESGDSKLIQFILCGQPELLSRIERPELALLSQRISTRVVLGPMDEIATRGYIQHQLKCAGMQRPNLFTDSAIEAIYEATEGVARRVNQLCDHAMLLAYVSDSLIIHSDLVEQALCDLDGAASQASRAAASKPETGESGARQVAGDLMTTEYDTTAEPNRGILDVYDRTEYLCVPASHIEEVADTFGNTSEEGFDAAKEGFDLALPGPEDSAEDEVFEEIVLDRYAAMDEAFHLDAEPAICSSESHSAVPETAGAIMPEMLQSQRDVLADEPSDSVPTADEIEQPGACEVPEVQYVEPGDASYFEVGAGIEEDSAAADGVGEVDWELQLDTPLDGAGDASKDCDTEQPIEHTRLDRPQILPMPRSVGYRRLFSKAKRPANLQMPNDEENDG